MTTSEIRSKIRHYERQIDQLSKEKRELERQIDELEALGNKYSGLQSKFGDRQQKRQGGLSFFLSSCIQNKILKGYYKGMNGLLGGSDFNNAYSGLSEAKSKINKEIRKLDDRVDECERDINYSRDRRDYWRGRLAQAQAEEAE